MGTPEQNQALVQRFIDALGRGDAAAAAACFDPERYYSHTFEADLAGTWERMKANRRAGTWTDVESTNELVGAFDDRVVRVETWSATHSGEFLGLPPTGRRVTTHFLEMWRVEDGKIVEHWGGFNAVPVYRQLTEGAP